MGEYQYYEFQAIDQPLSREDIKELRAYSTRAEITPSSFINEYSYGDFRGDVNEWMKKYFDAFIYFANWGTHIFKLSFPAEALDFKMIQGYCKGDGLEVVKKGNKIILTFSSDSEEDAGWVDAGDWPLASLLPLRLDLIRGDFRSLYIGWLLCVQEEYGEEEEYEEDEEELDEDRLEPPVPPGLAELNESLIALIEFLDINQDLIDAAAALSPPLKHATPNQDIVHQWVKNLDLTGKNEWLTQILMDSMQGNQKSTTQLLQNFLKAQGEAGGYAVEQKRRTVGKLKAEAKHISDKREQLEAEKKAKEKEQREKEQQLARKKHLDALMGREPILWREIGRLINQREAASYKKAIELLIDLQDLAAREKNNQFHLKLDDLRHEHARLRSFIKLLNEAGLG